MKILTDTPFETTLEKTADYSAYVIFGCGIVLPKTSGALKIIQKNGIPVHKIFGKNVGFSLFTYAL